MRIAIASGKGGTGKTLVSTNLAWYLAGAGQRVAYVDTDVEEPNGHIFLQPEQVQTHHFSMPVPELPGGVCSGCGACQRQCFFGAIEVRGRGVALEERLCHSCGACLLVCEEGALAERPRRLGTFTQGKRGPLTVWSGQLDVGEPKAAPLIGGLLRAVADERGDRPRLELLDVAPGTSCSAVAATRKADQVVLVTEPTPFGLHDLALAVEMCRALNLPIAVVLNRADLGDGRVQRYLSDEEIPLLAEIPFMLEVAQAYARRQLAAEQVPAFQELLAGLAGRLATLEQGR